MSALKLLVNTGMTRIPGPGSSAPLIQSHPTGTGVNSNAQVGWRFTVGNTPLTAVRAALSKIDAGTEVVRIWRVSDSALIASVQVVVVGAGVGGEADFATSVTLAANTSYVVATRRLDGTSRGWSIFSKAAVTFDPRITADAAHGNYADTYPGQDSSSNVYGLVNLFVT